MLRRLASALPVLAILIAACSDDPSPAPAPNALQPGDELTYELFANTKELSPETLGAIQEVTSDGRIVFTGDPAQLAAITKGNVVLGAASDKTPSGLLRFVLKVERTNGQLVLSTTPAPVELAFKKLHMKMARELSTEAPAVPVENKPLSLHPLGGARSTTALDYFVYNTDRDASTKRDQVHVTGTLGAGFDFFFGLDVDWGDVLDLPGAVADCVISLVTGGGCSVKDLLPEVKIGYSVSADAKADLAIEGVAFYGFERDYTLAKLPVKPKYIAIGPLVFVLEADVQGHVEGGASSEFALSTGASFLAKSSISYSSKTGGVADPWKFEKTFTAPAVTAGLTAFAKVSVGPKLAIKLFDFAGPYMGVLGFAKLEANALKAPCFSAKVGLDAELGFEIGIDIPILGKVTLADYNTKSTLLEEEVATGSCVVPPNESMLPPGAGPDTTHLQTPTYTPWSKTFTEFLDEYPASPKSYSWTDLTRGIDGSYVIAGARAKSLVKMDETGKLLWAEQFTDPELGFNADRPLRPGRVTPSDDAEMFVTTYPWTLLKIGQSGGLRWAKRLVTGPHDGNDGAANGNAQENNQFGGALADGAGGAFLLSSDQAAGTTQTRAWFTRVSREGAILASKALGVAGRQVYPIAVAPADGGVFVTGTLYDTAGYEQGFAMRLKADGSVVWAKRLVGCADGPAITPYATLRTREGKYMIVGRNSIYERSFALMLAGADGGFLSSSNPWTGSDTEYAVIKSIVELPTSGFVVAGDYEAVPSGFRRLFTAGLDSIGIPLWSQGYRFPDRDSSFPALIATDAGGLFVAGESTMTTLWTLTPFARDGKITLNPTSGSELEARPLVNGACAVSVSALDVVVTDLPVTVADRPVTVSQLVTTPAVQSP